jgi:hypothetical protein
VHLIQAGETNASASLHGHNLNDIPIAHKTLVGQSCTEAKSCTYGILQHAALSDRTFSAEQDKYNGQIKV